MVRCLWRIIQFINRILNALAHGLPIGCCKININFFARASPNMPCKVTIKNDSRSKSDLSFLVLTFKSFKTPAFDRSTNNVLCNTPSIVYFASTHSAVMESIKNGRSSVTITINVWSCLSLSFNLSDGTTVIFVSDGLRFSSALFAMANA